jgi:hypothetical protein
MICDPPNVLGKQEQTRKGCINQCFWSKFWSCVHTQDNTIIYINSLRPSVCLTGVLGGGGGRGWWSSGWSVSVCDGGWTTTVSVYKPSPQNIAVVRRVGMTIGSHPSPIAPEVDIKTFPPAPHYRKNWRLYRRACFRKFPKLSGTKVQNVRTGVLGFLTWGKGVNTQTDNLRVHTAGSDTHTTSIGTTAHSGWLEWRSHGCSKVTGTTN